MGGCIVTVYLENPLSASTELDGRLNIRLTKQKRFGYFPLIVLQIASQVNE